MLLEKYLKNLITQTGPISMAEFMQAALAHPEHGYYKTAEPFGVAGDFTTAPEISQMFGELIGIWCADIWQQMGCPANIELVEIGPGRGTLMDDLLRTTIRVPGFHDSISIAMVETSKRLKDIQHAKINQKHPRIKWLQNVSELPQKPLIIVANELFDALPVHQYFMQEGQWCEKMVGLNRVGELEFLLGNPLLSTHPQAGDGATLETCPLAITIMEEISTRIKQHGGAALIIDYGYIKSEYKNTISAILNHKHHDILSDIGKADLSAHVDFGLLRSVAENKGINVCGAISQGDFLRNMGIAIRVEKLSKNASVQQQNDIEAARYRLVDDTEMGKLFKVLAVCNKGVEPGGF